MNEMFNLSQMSGLIPSPELNVLANQGLSNSFYIFSTSIRGYALKWVNGTTVKRCYGCSMEIVNHPKVPLEELVIVLLDYREYRQRLASQI